MKIDIQTLLIGGAVAVGGYFVYKELIKRPAAPAVALNPYNPPPGANVQWWQQLIATTPELATSIINAINSGKANNVGEALSSGNFNVSVPAGSPNFSLGGFRRRKRNIYPYRRY